MRHVRGQCRIVSPVALSLRPRGKRQAARRLEETRQHANASHGVGVVRWYGTGARGGRRGLADPADQARGTVLGSRHRDLLARLVADRLGPALSQPVVVEHRPGAGGIVGQEQVARASPDGYTLVVSSLGSRILRYALSAAARSADGRRAWPRPLGVRFRVA